MNIQNNSLHETPNHKTTFNLSTALTRSYFAFRYQIYLKGDLLTMIYKCSTYLGRWEIIARCSQVSEETRRASSFISRRLFESVIRNEPCAINVTDLVSCHSQSLWKKFPYEIIYPVIIFFDRKRRWHRYNFILHLHFLLCM